MLLQNGYNTFCVGKWHLTPPEHTTAAGPYDRWPLGRGFERYYGFLGGETNQWYPELTYDNHEVEQPALPEDGYHISVDLADKAIEFIQDAHVNAPDKPFFMYYATGAGHAPHHVPKEWADKYKGKFDGGWEEYRKVVHQRQLDMGIIPPGTALSAQDPDVPEWETLSDDAKRLYARYMEVYAGFVSFTDHHFGRVVEFLREIGELDNTLIMVISDNGASSEGSPVGSLNEMFFFNNVQESLEANLKMIDELGGVETCNHYPWGWANAGNTPFRRWKRETYRGGTTDPCIVSWPERHPGSRRAADSVRALHRPGSDRAGGPRHRGARGHPRREPGADRRHQLRAHLQRRGRAEQPPHAVLRDVRPPRDLPRRLARGLPVARARTSPRPPRRGASSARPSPTTCSSTSRPTTGSSTTWTRTPPRPRTSPGEHRDRLIELIGRWWAEAGKYQVLPIDGTALERLNVERPTIARPRNKFVYYPGGSGVPFTAAPKGYNRPWSITADVVIPEGRRRGHLAGAGRPHRRLRVLRPGPEAVLPLQLAGSRAVLAHLRRDHPGR